ncbi:50S ribosomal protein L24 [Ornithobacterium rhinotracheale]|uniref:50S ribosomal protein L24 n=1 Tax=Ornithobacterium rhinotracheale TaxID=28251 RepID=UPI00129C3962|nr:50S ribosomal protein L24 [Ornithobacterium rhinotracheale]MRJ11125.1 50S ribosomal protein L24 [Ornithobacterium rhinotracheale]
MAQVKKLKIKKGDQVVVLSGSDKGKKGEVLEVRPRDNKAIVQGVNMIKKHTKPSAQNPQGGILETEAPIQISNLAIVDPETGKATRVGFRMEGDKKVRFAKKSGKTL